VPSPESGHTLIVVGDTHGQLADVLYIFSVHGPPSPTNVYLFNGDIADRGPCACEICALLLCYKLAIPDSIFINRGNHENSDINERPAKNGGGFAAEVRSKYDRETFHLFQQFFCALPLATVLGDECVVVHGGLCRLNPTIDQMKLVKRQQQCPDMPLTLDETILFDSLWADPAADGEPAGSGRGGVCYSFDEVATSKFLTLNGLSLVIRSHQLPPKQRGYMLHHSNKVLTIFSASNYCGVCNNHGAILILRGGMSEVWEYRAPPMDVLLATWEESKATREKERAKRFLALKKGAMLGIGDIALAQIRSTRWGGHTKERRVSLGSVGRGLSQKSLILSDYVPDANPKAGVAGMEVSVVRALKERICLHRAELLRAFHRGERARRGKAPRGAKGPRAGWLLYERTRAPRSPHHPCPPPRPLRAPRPCHAPSRAQPTGAARA
jgi:diadenosine tetraphosphatase ApaH/serine/threonine PP2A family protein phosphatase